MGTRKNIKPKKFNKRFRKTRSKRQRGGGIIEDKNLLDAAKNNNLVEVRNALADGAIVDAKSNRGKTALIWASQNGSIVIVEMLLGAGADVNEKDNYGGTALTWATNMGHIKIVKKLLEMLLPELMPNLPRRTMLMMSSWPLIRPSALVHSSVSLRNLLPRFCNEMRRVTALAFPMSLRCPLGPNTSVNKN